MSSAREAARNGLELGLAAIRHTGWWLQWQTNRHACREAAELELLHPQAAGARRTAA